MNWKGLIRKVLSFAGAVCIGIGAAGMAGEAPAPNPKDAELLRLIDVAMSSRSQIQSVVKDYLYLGNDVAASKAKREMKASLKAFEQNQKRLSEAFSDPKTKNLMVFIGMNVDELKEQLSQPYSKENAQVLIDLGEAISEGEKKIADTLRKRLSREYPASKGQSYAVTQIAKYYMAYQAGIKDENTVRQMDKTVKEIESLIREMKAYPANTVKMNQIINQIDKLWKVVQEFYLDIEEGGLPVIVYQTTERLNKKFEEYSQALIASLSTS